MNSKLLLFVITGLIASPFVNEIFAEPGDVLFTIKDYGLKQDMFRSSVDTVGDKIVVGAMGKNVDGIDMAGGLYVFDSEIGDLLFTIDNPDPKRDDKFGKNLITTDNNIVVGMQYKNEKDLKNKGMIYVFEGNTGELLYTINDPNEMATYGSFGYRMGSFGDNVISASSFRNSEDKTVYLTHVFDDTGELLYTLDNSNSNGDFSFGFSFVFFNERLAVYAGDEEPNDDIHTNTIQVFDAKTGSFQYTIDNPDPTTGYFGRYLAEVNDNLVVGVPTHEYGDDDSTSGFIYIFDGQTGKLSLTINYPGENMFDSDFGAYLTSVGENIALRSTSDQMEDEESVSLSDVFYIFDGKTGELLLTIDEPFLKDQNSVSH